MGYLFIYLFMASLGGLELMGPLLFPFIQKDEGMAQLLQASYLLFQEH